MRTSIPGTKAWAKALGADGGFVLLDALLAVFATGLICVMLHGAVISLRYSTESLLSYCTELMAMRQSYYTDAY
jgi:hypothetical protein